MDLGLSGKNAIVTGAASGIGRQVAIDLAAEGANIVAADMNLEGASETIELIGSGKAMQLDVTSLENAKQVVADTVSSFGSLDIMVNCAGAWRLNTFMKSSPEDWAFEINVNLFGVINCTRAALDPMTQNGGGKIVNISSDAGRVGEFRQAVYSGAKAGVIGFTKAVAREVGKSGVHLNCVCPGLTSTPGTAPDFDEEMEQRIGKTYPLRKIGVPQDVSRVVVFLTSDGASHVTGQTMSVSGGYSMV